MTDNNIINEITLDENDGISYAVDFVLSAPGIKKACKTADTDWIILIGNKSMEAELKELPPIEQEILKLYFVAGKSLIDIAVDLNIPIELVYGHIKSMRMRLMRYV